MTALLIDILGLSSPSDTARWRAAQEDRIREAIKNGEWRPWMFTEWQRELVREAMEGWR